MLITGGCEGSDLFFEACATCCKDKVFIFSFANHKLAPYIDRTAIINKDTSNCDIVALRGIAKRLGRKLPTEGYVLNLLKRNQQIANSCHVLYAIGKLSDKEKGIVDGGTAWGIEVFIERCPVGLIYLWFFDIEENCWKVCEKLDDSCKRRWVPCTFPEVVPTKSLMYAGIGTRSITEAGRQAIASLFISMNGQN